MTLHARRPAAAPAVVKPVARLATDDLRRLETTLSELAECRRLLDEALAEQA